MSSHFEPISPPHQGPAKRKKVTFSSDTRLYDRGTPVLSSPSCNVMDPDSKCSSLSEMVNHVCALADRTKLHDDQVVAGIINLCTEMTGSEDDDAILAAFYDGADEFTKFTLCGIVTHPFNQPVPIEEYQLPDASTDTSDDIGSPRALANMATMRLEN